MIHSVKGEKMQIAEYDIARCIETLDSSVSCRTFLSSFEKKLVILP